MKKIFRRSQKKDVLGYCIHGMEMYKYGLPYRNACGFIFPEDEELVDLMFIAVEKNPELHIVTNLNEICDYRMVNCYETENADLYQLYTGNSDPDIEFTQEVLLDDWTPEQRSEGRRHFEEFGKNLTPAQIAAVNFSIDRMLNHDRVGLRQIDPPYCRTPDKLYFARAAAPKIDFKS